MEREAIIAELKDKHQSFIDYILGLPKEEFLFSLREEKWTAGQELDHILKGVSPLGMAFSAPKVMLKARFGTANRPSRTYDGLVEKYQSKLSEGGRAGGSFLPDPIAYEEREALADKLQKQLDKLLPQVSKFKEKDLDELILPHPLVGKLTLREMLYFTIYHVQHHHRNSQRNLAEK